ncbi:MBL fold metallo-hydrolase [Gordonia sp. ABSL11-1]|uniref:MBL fold metallo-hydrolase n=1 Tax=Gordonia sp. ABSL11-1 TaxID=3053924 RepID=UPI002572B1E0|nr:MBL fold metallo-hydrolase [Gordonia sp. ABSL11-1]MDL9948807.1 MBL fold metallo-hydrolase [Gordonia sp. ABSL11-1]
MTSTTGRTSTQLAQRAASTLATAGISAADVLTAGLARRGLPAARALGADSADIRRFTIGSPYERDGAFRNLEPAEPQVDADLRVVLDMARRPGRPRRPVEVLRPDFAEEAGDLRATWLGHASVLVELDGVRILTDPVFSARCSPSQLVGPARMHAAPASVADLPPVDVVLISHDHYDHLDMATVVDLAERAPHTRFVTAIGVGAHLIAWGIAADRIEQADWWEERTIVVGGTSLTFTCCPARHFSGRGLSRNLTQWSSWVVAGPSHRMFFSGDTGFSDRFEEITTRVGPVDLTLIAVGAYDPLWPEVHVNPEEAIAVHRMLTGDRVRDAVMIPIHWGTFNLARHSWADPIARLLPSAEANTSTVVVPPPGGGVDVVHRTGTAMRNPAWWEASA